MKRDLKKFHIGKDGWYHDAQDRGLWKTLCKEGLFVCFKERLESRGVRRVGDGVTVPGSQSKTAPPSALLMCDIYHR